MPGDDRSFWSYAAPIALSMGVFCGLNALWNHPQLALYKVIEQPLVVYLLGGSGLSLLLLWRALRDGRLTRRDVGLDLSNWTGVKWILGMMMVLSISYGGYRAIAYMPQPQAPAFQQAATDSTSSPSEQDQAAQSSTVASPPPWSDYCFFFILLLGASLAELLVFVAIGFCLTEKWLNRCGMNRFLASTIAAVLASVAFGLYHFTHSRVWWSMVVFPLMPVMMSSVICFVVTRNFYLTLAFHNALAALGVTIAKMGAPDNDAFNIERLQQWDKLLPTLAAFFIPFLVLHWFEVRGSEDPESTGES